MADSLDSQVSVCLLQKEDSMRSPSGTSKKQYRVPKMIGSAASKTGRGSCRKQEAARIGTRCPHAARSGTKKYQLSGLSAASRTTKSLRIALASAWFFAESFDAGAVSFLALAPASCRAQSACAAQARAASSSPVPLKMLFILTCGVSSYGLM